MTKESVVPQTIKLNNAYAPGLIIKGALSQSANLQEWQNSAGTVLSRVQSDGTIRALSLNTSSYISDEEGTRPYINFTVPNKLIINTRDAAYVGLTIKGAASQSANLQEWQNSAGTVLSRIREDGTGFFPIVEITRIFAGGIPADWTNYSLYSYSTAANRITLGIQGNASQTADLTQWQNSTGTVAARVESGGALNVSPVAAPNGYSIYVIGAGSSGIVTMKSTATSAHAIQLQNSANTIVFKMDQEGRIVPAATTSVGLTVRGVASQTADLTQWQNSAGTVLTNVRYDGSILITKNGDPATGVAAPFMSSPVNSGYSSTAVYSFWYQSGTGISNPYVQTLGINTNAIERMRFTSDGLVLINSSSSTLGGGSVASQLGVVIAAATTVGAVIRGAASQTANLQEWQNSAGTYVALVDYLGTVRGTNLASNNATYTATTMWGQGIGSVADYLGDSISLLANKSVRFNATASTVSVIVKGAASQTADLQQWQNSAGTVLAKVDASGKISATLPSGIFGDSLSLGVNGASDLIRIGYSSGISYIIPSIYGQLQIQLPVATAGFAVKGAASQSANLQEWQNSAGTVLSGINAAGQIYAGTTASINGSTTTAIWSAAYTSATVAVFTYGGTSLVQAGQRVTVAGVTGGTYNGTWTVTDVTSTTFTVLGSGFTNVAGTGGTFTLSAVGSFVAGTSGTTPIVVRGATSQNANLQEWQNSAGTVLSGINNAGQIYAGTTTSINGSTTTQITNRTYAGSSTVETFEYSGTSLVQVGQKVTLSNFAFGTENFNGTWLVTAVTSNSFTVLGSGFPNTIFGSLGRFTVSSPASFVANTAVTTPIVVRGIASQTANLQEWQNSTGFPLLRINSAGQIQALQSSGLVVKAATTLTATVTNAIGDGGVVTYIAENTFTSGQIVTITGVSPAAYNLSSVVIDSAYSSYFTVNNAATGTYVSGGTATVAQIANLQEWQNSAGTILPSIAPNGTLTMKSINSANIATFYNGTSGYGAGAIAANGTFNINGANMGFPYTASGAVLSVNATSATSVPITSRGYASQTANLQEWQLSNGTTRARIDAYGTFQNGTAVGYGAWINVQPTQASDKGIVVRGTTSQTANLQEWQDSSGSVLSSFDQYGRLRVRTTTTSAFSAAITAASAGTVGLMVQGAASQTANLQEWQNSSGTVTARFTKDGEFSVTDAYVAYFSGASNYSATLNVQTADPTYAGLVIRGKSAQTGDLQKWQNSAGTVLASVGAYGEILIKPSSASVTPLIIQASPTYPAAIQQWQNSSGTTLAQFRYNGALDLYDIAPLNSNSGTYISFGSGALNVLSRATTTSTLIVKGVASQTADLQQWQNSAGTTLSAIDNSGNFTKGDGDQLVLAGQIFG